MAAVMNPSTHQFVNSSSTLINSSIDDQFINFHQPHRNAETLNGVTGLDAEIPRVCLPLQKLLGGDDAHTPRRAELVEGKEVPQVYLLVGRV